MLTMEPGPDIAPLHDRQIAILDCADWATDSIRIIGQANPESAARRKPERGAGRVIYLCSAMDRSCRR
jgi:hypothetical protein